jgi:hypothetical protein
MNFLKNNYVLTQIKVNKSIFSYDRIQHMKNVKKIQSLYK